MALLVVVALSHLLRVQSQTCDQGEYSINGECCPMCPTGNRVQRHCKSGGSTACIPCVSETYMDHPSGLTECFNCKSCDSGSGLIIKVLCAYTKNTVCGCMLGYYCDDPKGEDCDSCTRQTICEPDSKVVTPGTEKSDTICEKCPPGTFATANMSGNCIESTRCSYERHIGTDICTGRHRYSLIAVCIFVLSCAIIVAYVLWMKKSPGQNAEETKTQENELLPISGVRSQSPVEITGDEK